MRMKVLIQKRRKRRKIRKTRKRRRQTKEISLIQKAIIGQNAIRRSPRRSERSLRPVQHTVHICGRCSGEFVDHTFLVKR